MDIWLPAIFGVVGTLLGALASGATSFLVQKHQAKAALDLRRTEAELAAMTSLESGLWEISQYARSAPSENVKHWSDAERAAWGKPIHDLIGPLSIAARGVRNSEVRQRLVDILHMIENWGAMSRRAHPIRYVPPLVEHALDCLGALRRGDQVSLEDEAYKQLKEMHDRAYVSTSGSS
ncbi:hypothetical protein I2W78_22970 [Streptomyces spinoverrucosus]|uniref:hypothetical protein n=1 Tax=Streptomyces spinoverrucosus TaxID=284043 RepID=UPI0018C39A72|nr:hypothetical protein [Streptomyces spinoverrucosus]MBG0854625.1 hypothetical protein [Streptomyces spinoverrucosus]